MPAPPGGQPIDRLREIMQILRSEDGCPWDREQTLETLKPYLVEETYEVLDAIDSGDRKLLAEELGDLLLQVVFQSQLCAEEGAFTFDDVAGHIAEKLVRRHPHVFGDIDVEDSDEVLRNWDSIKREERAGTDQTSALDGVPRHLPALLKAEQVQRRAARVGFDWDDLEPVLAKVEEELGEIRDALAAGDRGAAGSELGDLLFAAVNLGRFLERPAEDALQDTIARFGRRFRRVESLVQAAGRDWPTYTLDELDAYWEQAKDEES